MYSDSSPKQVLYVITPRNHVHLSLSLTKPVHEKDT